MCVLQIIYETVGECDHDHVTMLLQVRNTKAVVIQRNVRGFVQRRKFQREMRGVVLVQASLDPRSRCHCTLHISYSDT